MEETTTTDTPIPQVEGAKEQFTIETREHAEWYLRKLANLDREEASIKAQADAMLRRLRSDREGLQGRYQGQFESFVRGELERTKSKRRSVLFFNGTAQFTATPARLIVESEADALATAAAVCPSAVVEVPATVKLDKKALLDYAKAQFEATGELLPGVGRTEASERFAIKFSEEKGESAGEGDGDA
jgi:Bacteriophage Mu Gam like protein